MIKARDYWEVAREVCSTRQFEVLELHHRYGMALRPIALQIGISVSTVRGHLERAEQKIALQLKADYFDNPEAA